MSERFEILVVCLGNVCRSPVAERLLRLRLDEAMGAGAHSVTVRSAGVRALVGEPMNELAEEELRRLGGDSDGFVASQFTDARAAEADLILTATRSLRSRALEEAPRALKRTFTIREFAALCEVEKAREATLAGPAELVARAASWRGSVEVEDYDVPDPIGQSPAFHRSVADLLDTECSVIAKTVSAAILSDVSPR